MAKSFISERIIFLSDVEKKAFLSECIEKGVTAYFLSEKMGLSRRTAHDWLRGKYSMPEKALVYIIDNFDVSMPEHSVTTREEHLQSISVKGGVARYKKYGVVSLDETKRKRERQKWWEKEGNKDKNSITRAKDICYPDHSDKLAEFVGIMLGDGTVAPYHIAVTLHKFDDKEYSAYVVNLFQNLFSVRPRVYLRKVGKVLDVKIHRKKLSLFCQSLGLPLGDKIRGCLSVPDWIMQNERFSRYFLRGLFDTDGSVYTHTYMSGGRKYERLVVSITNAYAPFVREIYKILKNIGFSVRITRNQKEVRIEAREYVEQFFSQIGSKNRKHIKSFLNGGLAERSKAPHC